MPVQMVTIMDQGGIPLDVVTNSYEALYKLVAKALYRTHVEGKLKARAFLHKAFLPRVQHWWQVLTGRPVIWLMGVCCRRKSPRIPRGMWSWTLTWQPPSST